MHIRPIAAGASTTTKSIGVSIAPQRSKQSSRPRRSDEGRKCHMLGVAFPRGDVAMQFDSMRAVAARAIGRSVGVFTGYLRTKRCWRCQHLLSKRAIVCMHCRKWQA